MKLDIPKRIVEDLKKEKIIRKHIDAIDAKINAKEDLIDKLSLRQRKLVAEKEKLRGEKYNYIEEVRGHCRQPEGMGELYDHAVSKVK